MNFVLAPDSFKGTLTQVEVAKTMQQVLFKKWKTAHVVMKPMADGGEGTLAALLAATDNSKKMTLNVTGPLGDKITTDIGIINSDTVVIEVATIAGLPLVPKAFRHPFQTTTYGIGEAIKFALDQGYRKFLIGLGGSVTNDGGLGLLQALGVSMQTTEGEPAIIFGKDLLTIDAIDFQTIDERIWDCEITIASDVDNSLCGKKGATYIFGPQKGLLTDELEQVDQAMMRYASLVERSAQLEQSFMEYPGAGSAGGLGFSLLLLKGKLVSGAEVIAHYIDLEEAIAKANYVFTGEGKSDLQTLYGKAPGYVAELAKKHHVPSILVSGSISEADLLKEHFSKVYSLVDEHVSLQKALNEPKEVLLHKMKQVLTDLEQKNADN